MQKYQALGREVTLGVAFIPASAIIRGVLTAIFWVRPPYAPHDVCAQLNDGLDWLLARCEQRRVSIAWQARVDIRRAMGIGERSFAK